VGALAHDIAYERGGTEEDRQRADRMFFRLCVLASKRRVVPKLFAHLYYLCVHNFGRYFFSYKFVLKI